MVGARFSPASGAAGSGGDGHGCDESRLAGRREPSPPTDGKGAVDEEPRAADGPIGADHEVRPPELLLHLFVALFAPSGQPVQPDDLGQVGRGQRAVEGLGGVRPRQIGEQVPGRQGRQGRWVRRGDDRPCPFIRTRRAEGQFGRPAGLGLPIPKGRSRRVQSAGSSGPRHASSAAASAGVCASSRGAQTPLDGLRANT